MNCSVYIPENLPEDTYRPSNEEMLETNAKVQAYMKTLRPMLPKSNPELQKIWHNWTERASPRGLNPSNRISPWDGKHYPKITVESE